MAIHNKIYWTKEQDIFLKNNSNKLSRKELTILFNKTFNTNYNQSAIDGHCKRNHWYSNNNGKFKKGNKPKGITPFKHNVGDIITKYRSGRQNGIQYIVISTERGIQAHKRMIPYSRYIYEQHHNIKVKDDECIIMLDGNYKNLNIDNLYKIPKSIATSITNMNAWKKGIITKAAIELLIAEYTINRKRKEIL